MSNLPWKKIAIGTGIGFAGAVIALTVYHKMKDTSAQHVPAPTITHNPVPSHPAANTTAPHVVTTSVPAASPPAGVSTPPATTTTPQMHQVGQIDYYNWNAGNKPARLGENSVDVANWYRYTPVGGDLPSLHQQEARLMQESAGTAQLVHLETEHSIGNINDHNVGGVKPRGNGGIAAVVLNAPLDVSPVHPPSKTFNVGSMDNFWQNQGPLDLQPLSADHGSRANAE